MVIKGEGENLTVSTIHPSLGEMTGTGTLKGNDIAITLTATGDRKIGFELKGTVTGDKMAGTREVKIPEDAKEGARGGDQSDSQRSRRDASGDDQMGAQRSDRGDSSSGDQVGSQRGARGDSSGGEKAGPQGGASSRAPGSDSSKAKVTSKAWTAERK